MNYRVPPGALMDAVVVAMAAEGFTVPHLFGAKHRVANGAPPRYVWVPTHVRDRKGPISRPVEQFRTLFAFNGHIEIDCWGADFDHAGALLESLCKALNDASTGDIQLEGGEWARPGMAWNQRGELFRLEISLGTPMPDRYLDAATLNVATGPNPPPAIEEPQPSTVVIARVEADIFKSPTVDQDGELGVKVSTS